MKATEVHIVDTSTDMRRQLLFHEPFKFTKAGDLCATVAVQMMAHGAGLPIGETSAGDVLMRPYTVDEIVSRAVELAQKLYPEIEKQGWILEVPSWDEVRKNESAPVGFRVKE